MSVGFFEKSHKNKSMMRLLSFLGFILGGLISIWGMVLLTITILSIIDANPAGTQIVGSLILLIGGGLGLAGGGEALKVIQQKSESKEVTSELKLEDIDTSSNNPNTPRGVGL